MSCAVVEGKLTFLLHSPLARCAFIAHVFLHEQVDYLLNNIVCHSCRLRSHIKGNPLANLSTCTLSDTSNKTAASASIRETFGSQNLLHKS